MKVISLEPQKTLITSGPYRFSRNPLYLGGNVFIFFGAALLLGSPSALLITAIHLPFVDLFIRREEKQLESILLARSGYGTRSGCADGSDGSIYERDAVRFFDFGALGLDDRLLGDLDQSQ